MMKKPLGVTSFSHEQHETAGQPHPPFHSTDYSEDTAMRVGFKGRFREGRVQMNVRVEVTP